MNIIILNLKVKHVLSYIPDMCCISSHGIYPQWNYYLILATFIWVLIPPPPHKIYIRLYMCLGSNTTNITLTGIRIHAQKCTWVQIPPILKTGQISAGPKLPPRKKTRI